ncbi:MAG: hypothetical protein KDD11_04715 [Acidobacteria bacterium]|nr:hypothetical protein [Acidobacteriota bacterium]
MTRTLALTLLFAATLALTAGSAVTPLAPTSGEMVHSAITAPAPMSQLGAGQVEATSFDGVLTLTCDEVQCWRDCRAGGAWGGSCVNGFCHCEEHP